MSLCHIFCNAVCHFVECRLLNVLSIILAVHHVILLCIVIYDGAECHFVVSFAECPFSDCSCAEGHFVECHFAECSI